MVVMKYHIFFIHPMVAKLFTYLFILFVGDGHRGNTTAHYAEHFLST
jgi:aminoglycoside N3'-acetyltransferase